MQKVGGQLPLVPLYYLHILINYGHSLQWNSWYPAGTWVSKAREPGLVKWQGRRKVVNGLEVPRSFKFKGALKLMNKIEEMQ